MGDDGFFMAQAIEQSRLAMADGEVPVGAVLVHRGKVIATGRNACISHRDPTAHAEIVALRAGAVALNNYRLSECELYVTLEPCAMCAGAILHARLKRVVFGAFDPKAGAIGSIFSLFDYPQLNPHTSSTGGVLAVECGDVLKSFFRARRDDQRHQQIPLRDDALRTPEARFPTLPQVAWTSRFICSPTFVGGLRMHFLDEGDASSPCFLCIHSKAGWSYEYRHLMTVLAGSDFRMVVPDLIGFGKSDKPKRKSAHTLQLHLDSLIGLLDVCRLERLDLIVHSSMAMLAQALVAQLPGRIRSLVVLSCDELFKNESADVWTAPFPDKGHMAALDAFPNLLEECVDRSESQWNGPIHRVNAAQWFDVGAELMSLLREG
jgi:tRNA(adenine34) deaminase